jgi:hypothetical protein
MPTTIGRNRRQYVINIRTEYTECRRYDQDSGEMVPAPAEDAWALLDRDKGARLFESDDRTVYTIRLGNDFYELRKPRT